MVSEMTHLHKLGYGRFVLVHDLLTANKHFVSELCDAILAS
jgi:hypothetical protein